MTYIDLDANWINVSPFMHENQGNMVFILRGAIPIFLNETKFFEGIYRKN